jgi:hypothetical protein
MSGTRISELPVATLPLAGTEEVPLRVGPSNARVAMDNILWAARGVPVAQKPDGGVGGGNERGAGATDFQSSRTNAAQVASGANSAIVSGVNNTASGAESFVGAGSTNAATGSRAVLCGGGGNTADGNNAWIPGGERATTRNAVGRGAWSSGRFATNGDAQSGEHCARALTTDAAVTRLTATAGAPSATNSVPLPNSGTYRLKLLVVAQQTGGSAGTVGDCASWEADVLIRRGANAAATAIVAIRTINDTPAVATVAAGTPFAPGMRDAGAAAWRLTLAADTTFGCLAISGTGEVNKTIRWVARVMGVEVTA